ncbi:hypothetical protein L810_2037 [Burkholderia sp. AU4i]|nr:hypothetical protein L810_2037 [Burkholderia sp. AU4i]
MGYGRTSHGQLLVDVRRRWRASSGTSRTGTRRQRMPCRASDRVVQEAISVIAIRVCWMPPARRSRHLFVFIACRVRPRGRDGKASPCIRRMRRSGLNVGDRYAAREAIFCNST